MRLSPAALAGLPAPVRRPGYDRAGLRAGVVHLGIGAFHRAHQAVYLDELMALSGKPDWGITGVSLRSPSVRDQLAPQGGLYSVLERGPNGVALRVIGSVADVLVAPESPEAVIERLAAPATRLVTLTVTEKGYCLAGADRRLDPNHPDIQRDLANPTAPVTAIGYLVAALERIRAAEGTPPVIIPCDNLAANGRTLKAALIAAAGLRDDRLARWIEERVIVPCSMVDRIVPATTEADRAEAAALLGLDDQGCVIAEPFTQWVVEDHAGAANYGDVGVEMVSDVEPYEHMKLRILNASHSGLAYLGQLAGLETIADSFAEPAFHNLMVAMIGEEVAPLIDRPPAPVVRDYATAVFARFRNPAIRHRTAQIAMDGSQKLPQRIFASIAAGRKAGAPVGRMTFVVAAWLRFLGSGAKVDDPRAAELTAHATPGSGAEVVGRMIALPGLFPAELTTDAGFRSALAEAYDTIERAGVRAAAKAATGP